MAGSEITTLTPAQVAALAPADLAAYSAEELGTMTSDQVAALTQDQLAALSTDQLAALAPAMAVYQDLIGTFQSAQSAAAAAARAAFLKPVTDLLAMPELAAVKDAVAALGHTFDGESIGPSLNCLRTGLNGLSAPL